MRFAFLIALTMVFFAANSVLNRMAVDGGHVDPGAFAVIRVLAGALTLVALARLQQRPLRWSGRARAVGAVSLALYMGGFSLGYLTLPAGLGALILFGAVQITIFVVSALRGAGPSLRQVFGAVIAFGGLVVVLNPAGATGADPVGAALMVLAGIGWGAYTLAGRGEPDALAGTAANFCLALPLTLLVPVVSGQPLVVSGPGLGLAILSGAVTSGIGYAMWYSIVPKLSPSTSAVLMLSVPVIAVAGGVLILGEAVGLRFLVGAVLVLGGIALSLRRG